MYDETQIKIMDATMSLIIEKGYSGATTKNIANLAGVNECTIFRKFQGKKEIVLSALEMPKWNPGLKEEDFVYVGNIKEDLISFSKTYMSKVTPRMVQISIGLRTAELENAALSGILQVPLVFKNVLIRYFTQMKERGIIQNYNVEALAVQFISMNFGFVFLDASFGDKLITIDKDVYIKNAISAFVNGITTR